MDSKQFKISPYLFFLAKYFPTVSWLEANEAYHDAVLEVHRKNNIDDVECDSIHQPYLDQIQKEFVKILSKNRKKIKMSRLSDVPYIWVEKNTEEEG